jgi:hypothetical protein
LPQTGPRLWKTKRLRPRAEGAARKHLPSANRSAAVIRARRGPSCGEQRVDRAWLPAPSCGPGSGPTGNCNAGNAGLRPATTNIPMALLVSPWVVRDAAPSSGMTAPTSVSRSTRAGATGCAHAETLPALTQVVGKKGESCIVDCSTMFPETKQSRRMAQQGRCGESECAFAVAFRREVREPRSARSSALPRLLKACESQLKKPSACTMSGAPLLHFRGGTAGCTCGTENLRCDGEGEGPASQMLRESLAGECAACFEACFLIRCSAETVSVWPFGHEELLPIGLHLQEKCF